MVAWWWLIAAYLFGCICTIASGVAIVRKFIKDEEEKEEDEVGNKEVGELYEEQKRKAQEEVTK